MLEKRVLWLLACVLAFAPQWAVGQQQLFAGLIRTKGYVVGSALASSGLYRFTGADTNWAHIGWNHPRISAIAFEPGKPDVFYLAAGSGVIGTKDGGQSWRIMTGWEVTESQDVAVDPNAPEQVYVATAYGIWRSRDAGASWTGPDETARPNRKYTQALAIDHAKAGRLFAGTWDGLYLSENAGETWSPVGPRGVPALDVEQSLTKPDVWIAGTQEQGVFLSGDGGRSWSRSGGAIADEVIYSVTIDPKNPQRMAAAGWDAGVYVSTNGGKSWAQRGRGLPTQNVYRTIFDPNQSGRIWAATVEQGIFRSDDLGKSWHYAGMNGTIVFDMVFVDRGQE